MKNYYTYFLGVLLITFFMSCKNDTDLSLKDCMEKQKISVLTSQSDKGWSFDILRNNKVYIHQTNIPAINELVLFSSENDAILVAELMVEKICRDVFPPSITIQELDSLKIKY